MIDLVNQDLQEVNPDLCVEPSRAQVLIVDMLARAKRSTTPVVDDKWEAGAESCDGNTLMATLILVYKPFRQTVPEARLDVQLKLVPRDHHEFLIAFENARVRFHYHPVNPGRVFETICILDRCWLEVEQLLDCFISNIE